ncbi:MAG: KAP family NTPase [Defluviitaleaceae bacterium]|nr:KAP family NTPase [Defluviitaleaceae bacterium]
MENFSTKPTYETAIEMFSKDVLGRNDEIARFVNLLDAIDDRDGFTIALNGDWGSGKTFFVKQTKLILDCHNDHSDLDDENRKSMKGIVHDKGLGCKGNYATAYYDAWANDNSEDPILSLMYSVLKGNRQLMPENKRDLADIFASIIEVVSGGNITGVLEKLRGDNPFESIMGDESIHELVKKFLNNLIVERGNRLVIFIDELDRCKPAFAIQLLERIKHYFDDNRVIFVFSVNLVQLQHTIKAHYGAGFDATRYMDKFFDIRISLPEINYDRYIDYKFRFMSHSTYYYDEVCRDTVKHFRFSLRETERYIRLTRIAYNQNNRIVCGFDNGACEFVVILFAPIIIGLGIKNLDLQTELLSGQNSTFICDILLNSAKSKNFLYHITKSDNYEEVIRGVYSALFISREPQAEVFGMIFNSEVRSAFGQVVSLLSTNCNYSFTT